MAKWCKVISAVLVAGSMAFAQYDYDYNNEESSTSEESQESYSYGDSDDGDFDSMDAADAKKKSEEEEKAKIGEATANSGEWEGFRYEEMGLTQWEFQQAREEGVSREKLEVHLSEGEARLREGCGNGL